MENKSSRILLRGGLLLIHDESNRITPRKSDLLIQGHRIHQIEDQITPPAETKIIDCEGAIISPGFIDTHRHLWQSQQKGLHCDQILLDYYYSGNLASSHYEAEDVFWGVLSSCMEAIDAGTTTVVDHAHANYSSEHNSEAIRAIIASGIRSVYCYCVHPRVTSWQPELKLNYDLFSDGGMDAFKDLAMMQPFGPNGRVTLGFAIDTLFVRPEVLKDTFRQVREQDVHLITSHATTVRTMGNTPSAVAVMNKNGLLGPDVLLSHGNNISAQELSWIKTARAHLSSTPFSELQMGHGHPICLKPDFLPLSSIGTDSNSISTSSIPGQAAAALQASRSQQMAEKVENRTWDGSVGPMVEDAFNLGTVLGAQAIGLGHEIGSLAVGKKADIVIFNGQTPSMVPVSEWNPVAGIMLHSSIRDIQAVIIDGIICKDNFSLNRISVPTGITAEHARQGSAAVTERGFIEWKDVVESLKCSRLRLEDIKSTVIDEERARNGLIKLFSQGAMN